MDKIDFKKTLRHLYNPTNKEVTVVDVPPMNYLLIDGRGDPNTAEEYAAAVSALFGIAYGLKFHLKRTAGVDYTVMPLEGLWWAEDMSQFSVERKSDWLWTMMILQPEVVTGEMFTQVLAEVMKKKISGTGGGAARKLSRRAIRSNHAQWAIQRRRADGGETSCVHCREGICVAWETPRGLSE